MNTHSLQGLRPVGQEQSAFILGGVDKRAQDALYTIGYVLGVVFKFVVALFTFNSSKRVFE